MTELNIFNSGMTWIFIGIVLIYALWRFSLYRNLQKKIDALLEAPEQGMNGFSRVLDYAEDHNLDVDLTDLMRKIEMIEERKPPATTFVSLPPNLKDGERKPS